MRIGDLRDGDGNSIAGGGGWIVAGDIDFALEAAASLSSDTTYSIGGFTWTKINSSNDNTAMALDGATGLVVVPKQTTDYGGGNRTAPALTIPLTSLISGLRPNTPIRVTICVASDNIGGNYDAHFAAIERFAASVIQVSYVVKRVYNSGIKAQAGVTLSGAATESNIADAGLAAMKAQTLLLPYGVAGRNIFTSAESYTSGTAPVTTNSLHVYAATTTGILDNSVAGNVSDWKLVIGAHRAGSGTALSVTISRVLVEYLS